MNQRSMVESGSKTKRYQVMRYLLCLYPLHGGEGPSDPCCCNQSVTLIWRLWSCFANRYHYNDWKRVLFIE